MKAAPYLSAGLVLALLWTSPVSAQPSAPTPTEVQADAGERERIGQERAAIEKRLQASQAACYQRFAVEDCLRAARRQARKDQAVLRQQESALDDRDRRERAAQRLKSIEERQSTRAADAPQDIRRGASQPQAARQRAQPKPQARPPDATADRQEARRQALEQRAKVQRERHEKKLQAAQERKARLQQRQAQDAARGRAPAAPLEP